MAGRTALNGWQRLNIVLSVLWLLVVAAVVFRDYESVEDGGPAYGFAQLKDEVTGETFGVLSKEEVAEMIELQAAQQQALNNARKRMEVESKLSASDLKSLKEGNLSAVSDEGLLLIASMTDAKRRPEPSRPYSEELKRLAANRTPTTGVNELGATLKTREVVQVLVGPLLGLWAVYYAIRWIVAGFRSSRAAG